MIMMAMTAVVSAVPHTQVDAPTCLSGALGRSSAATLECLAASAWKAWLRAEPCRNGATSSTVSPSRSSAATTTGNVRTRIVRGGRWSPPASRASTRGCSQNWLKTPRSSRVPKMMIFTPSTRPYMVVNSWVGPSTCSQYRNSPDSAMAATQLMAATEKRRIADDQNAARSAGATAPGKARSSRRATTRPRPASLRPCGSRSRCRRPRRRAPGRTGSSGRSTRSPNPSEVPAVRRSSSSCRRAGR